ncbi:hypothetical protein CYMTET_39017 [Cymbomonas tetramitiformis]|uniref:PWWP domain-containing protein n=1 Tax=Cymbomonas tetramitiformis TaxID=36881 RepID=A0AAE0F606_9CHLO|nr:hypothetical protein CYMTET_39017 [Cymbomonas tetramitiformis]
MPPKLDELNVDVIIFGKLEDGRPWPAKILPMPAVTWLDLEKRKNSYYVRWFGYHRDGYIDKTDAMPFLEHKDAFLQAPIKETIRDLAIKGMLDDAVKQGILEESRGTELLLTPGVPSEEEVYKQKLIRRLEGDELTLSSLGHSVADRPPGLKLKQFLLKHPDVFFLRADLRGDAVSLVADIPARNRRETLRTSWREALQERMENAASIPSQPAAVLNGTWEIYAWGYNAHANDEQLVAQIPEVSRPKCYFQHVQPDDANQLPASQVCFSATRDRHTWNRRIDAPEAIAPLLRTLSRDDDIQLCWHPLSSQQIAALPSTADDRFALVSGDEDGTFAHFTFCGESFVGTSWETLWEHALLEMGAELGHMQIECVLPKAHYPQSRRICPIVRFLARKISAEDAWNSVDASFLPLIESPSSPSSPTGSPRMPPSQGSPRSTPMHAGQCSGHVWSPFFSPASPAYSPTTSVRLFASPPCSPPSRVPSLEQEASAWPTNQFESEVGVPEVAGPAAASARQLLSEPRLLEVLQGALSAGAQHEGLARRAMELMLALLKSSEENSAPAVVGLADKLALEFRKPQWVGLIEPMKPMAFASYTVGWPARVLHLLLGRYLENGAGLIRRDVLYTTEFSEQFAEQLREEEPVAGQQRHITAEPDTSLERTASASRRCRSFRGGCPTDTPAAEVAALATPAGFHGTSDMFWDQLLALLVEESKLMDVSPQLLAVFSDSALAGNLPCVPARIVSAVLQSLGRARLPAEVRATYLWCLTKAVVAWQDSYVKKTDPEIESSIEPCGSAAAPSIQVRAHRNPQSPAEYFVHRALRSTASHCPELACNCRSLP